MSNSVDPIRIRARAREASRQNSDPRKAFWAPILESTDDDAGLNIPQLEGRLCRQFGGQLRSALLNELSKGLRLVDDEWFFGSLRESRNLFFHYLERFPGPVGEYQWAEVFTKYFEHRQKLVSENAALRDAHSRLMAAASIMFSTRIVGYSSLVFDISTGSIPQLAKAFDGNFETFRIFLEAFVPVAFGEVFDEDTFSDTLEFTVTIPSSVERAFGTAVGELNRLPSATDLPTRNKALPTIQLSADRERANWLWRLANGSLLIPVLIALVVMFFGIRLLLDIQATQRDAIEPILQHQLNLLKEDRLRFEATDGGKSTELQDTNQEERRRDGQ